MSIGISTLGTRTAPWTPAMERTAAMRLAGEEYRRVASAVGALEKNQWVLATDCADWTVRELVAHIAGMAAMVCTPWESSRQVKAASRMVDASGGLFIDALTGLQVSERSAAGPQELVQQVRRIGPKATRGRRLMPAFLRHRLMQPAQVVGEVEEWWTLGFLVDTILTRDPWMHRIDLARATSTDLQLTPGHDGAIVDDVVREWAARHGQPYRLTLTGPAGGSWSRTGSGKGNGNAGGVPAGNSNVHATPPNQVLDTVDLNVHPIPPNLVLDAVDFCRILSGRAEGEELLRVKVPF
ncbi:maleylpyruvate isomerase family mycothiol-dependent enzyme [Paenarthrobacter sp. Z7-10]|uniref:maleylpyruvate isomerase family mycothiol-dependent enzyme n=1 Tax=Paenarthrobacter sp. Z7-10 TaxID=2787635 RepID=UPI0022A92069|nr:maleylpyruvate isomerase family mycothiol-dependent enzyme [Paenarthrobacter sp. Z7-10]MCZ2403051.1 maleylpyruvate isomerase family mycothiol-dependent enzyme [Paenarthrobacter sp. Z7-10]